MTKRLVIKPKSFASIRAHLLQNHIEQVVFAYAHAVQNEDELVLEAGDFSLMEPEDFAIQSSYHVALTDTAQARVIKMAWDRRMALVEFHSHPHARSSLAFSPSDLQGFAEFVPHVWWRLKGQPYLALVLGQASFDALLWQRDPHTPEPLDYLQIGKRARRPTGLTIADLRGNHG